LVDEFKRGMNREIRRKLMEAKNLHQALNSGINVPLI